MSIFVVKGERTFYNDDVHKRIPSGAIKISQEFYEKLLQAQSEYKTLDFSVCPPEILERDAEWPSVADLQAFIDDQVASIYANWSRFEKEHLSRENAARQYKDAGYQGDAGIWIKSYADSAGLTCTEAADLIIQQAEQQRLDQEALAVLRMRKHELDIVDGAARFERYQLLAEEIAQIGSVDSY
ncbi:MULTISPECIES: hypothetical protein [Pseudomonas]|uniref:Phage tail protein n=1 Tax=Pseudomonas peradeniyensis TaxID=2745488 RepID=A0ABT2VB01_9PSED|nr:hypothetical protein [Pseudomonas peradeniyensis]MCU7238891.1 hypothetical protein [Pseudomonas peradeniyensis]MCU7281657.1 hypothetical protein [Pseudomonas peradeniyensis]